MASTVMPRLVARATRTPATWKRATAHNTLASPCSWAPATMDKSENSVSAAAPGELVFAPFTPRERPTPNCAAVAVVTGTRTTPRNKTCQLPSFNPRGVGRSPTKGGCHHCTVGRFHGLTTGAANAASARCFIIARRSGPDDAKVSLSSVSLSDSLSLDPVEEGDCPPRVSSSAPTSPTTCTIVSSPSSSLESSINPFMRSTVFMRPNSSMSLRISLGSTSCCSRRRDPCPDRLARLSPPCCPPVPIIPSSPLFAPLPPGSPA